jgi:hypothetical protein
MPKLPSDAGSPFQKVIVDEATGTNTLANDDVYKVTRMPRCAKPTFRLNINVIGPLQENRQ